LSGCSVEDNGDRGPHPLGELTALETADGSLSLHSDLFNEAFHSSAGALGEARAKFARPAELERFPSGTSLRVLDVCVGLGYNSAALMAALPTDGAPQLRWWGLELDPRPLALALGQPAFRRLWPDGVLARLDALHQRGRWQDTASSGEMLWGDARQTVHQLPKNQGMDLILLDAFSPGRCPQLWSEEFLSALAERLAPGGRLLTYSRAAAIRSSLRRTGLDLRSLLAAPGQRLEWSSGTLAVRSPLTDPLAAIGPGWQALTAMEEEHLLTRASVPFRDPNGSDDAETIQGRRKEEQEHCKMESTSAWQRRWIGSGPDRGHSRLGR